MNIEKEIKNPLISRKNIIFHKKKRFFCTKLKRKTSFENTKIKWPRVKYNELWEYSSPYRLTGLQDYMNTKIMRITFIFEQKIQISNYKCFQLQVTNVSNYKCCKLQNTNDVNYKIQML